MDFKQEDDFWNFTSRNCFEFDDEENDILVTEENDSVFHSTLDDSSTIPLRSIITPKNLALILDDVPLPLMQTSKTSVINETIKKLCCGIDCSLIEYKSECDKIQLLDKAIETCDGNVILQVIFYLVQTLKVNIVYKHLAKRPLALQQYCNYLANSNNLHTLHLLYMSSGNINNLPYLFYYSILNTSSNCVIKKLTQFNIEHLDTISDQFENSIFLEHKRFLDYKMQHKLNEELLPTVFANLCVSKLDKLLINDLELQQFLKITKMSSFKSEWIMLNVIVANERWKMLGETFQREKWFNIKGIRKYNISIELIVSTLHKHGAPRSVLEDFFKHLDDSDKALYLGRKYKCHSFVIDILTQKKDRLGLLEYKNCISSELEWLHMADKALLTAKGWAN